MIKVAVIGVGNMGYHHARNYSQMDGVKLVAVADINKELGREVAEKFKCRFYQDYRKMLKKEDLQAVSVVVPTKFHKSVALDVIGAGKHLLIEKPLAFTVGEGRQIVKAAKKAGLKLAVGHVERFNPAVIKLKELIRKRKIGKVVVLSAKRVGLFPSQVKEANVLLDLAIHDIDIFSYLLEEEPEKIFASSGKALANNREDHGEILLCYPSGITGMIQVNWITPVKIRTVSVTGTHGYAELDYITQKLKVYRSNYETKFDDFGDFIIKFSQPEIVEVDIKPEEPLKIELESFIESIKKNKEPEVNGEIGLTALKNVYKIKL